MGTAANNVLTGHPGDDLIYGLGGNDLINGRGDTSTAGGSGAACDSVAQLGRRGLLPLLGANIRASASC
ncbi:MAG: hypothetical protein M3291_05220 [Actinomycetota bacterium]|nr:hypothetical protein [Actinomycetota bacterium]